MSILPSWTRKTFRYFWINFSHKGCGRELGMNYNLRCGDNPTPRNNEIYSVIYEKGHCTGNPKGYLGIRPKCIVGPGISAIFQCDEREGRYIGTQYDNMDCSGRPARIQYLRSGCNNIFGNFFEKEFISRFFFHVGTMW
jgi:hypothetical protein